MSLTTHPSDDTEIFDGDDAGHEVSIASAQPRASNGRFMRIVNATGGQDDSGLPADRFLDREISWLQFNERVLQLAADESVPLLERARFLAIFTSNLDEFFMVRVAGLKALVREGVRVLSQDGLSAAQQLVKVNAAANDLMAEQQRIWRAMRAELTGHHHIQREALSVRHRMGEVLRRLGDGGFHRFESLFDASEGRLGIVVTFLALLELAKEHLIEIVQEIALAPIYLKSMATAAD